MDTIILNSRPATQDDWSNTPVARFLAMLDKAGAKCKVYGSETLNDQGQIHRHLGVRLRAGERHGNTMWSYNGQKWTRGASWLWGRAGGERVPLLKVSATELQAWATDEDAWVATYRPAHGDGMWS